MLTSFFSHKLSLLFVIGLALVGLQSCRKKIDFDQEASVSSGAVDPLLPVFAKWERVSSITEVRHIESNGDRIFYNRFNLENGNNEMYAMDTSGSGTYLFDVDPIAISFNSVSLIKYDAPLLYYCRSQGASLMVIKEFNLSGVQNEYSIDVIQGQGSRIHGLIDLGTNLLVAGYFQLPSSSSQSRSAFLMNKATGALTPMPGLINDVEDATLINNEVYVVGKDLISANTGMAKWDGSQWIDVGTISNNSTLTSIRENNGEIIVGGKLYPNETGIYTYNSAGSDFNENTQFTLGSESDADRDVIIKSYNGKLYAAGTLRLANLSFRSIYEYDNGNWRSIGGLGMTATDFAVCQGYIYAVADKKLFRHKL